MGATGATGPGRNRTSSTTRLQLHPTYRIHVYGQRLTTTHHYHRSHRQILHLSLS